MAILTDMRWCLIGPFDLHLSLLQLAMLSVLSLACWSLHVFFEEITWFLKRSRNDYLRIISISIRHLLSHDTHVPKLLLSARQFSSVQFIRSVVSDSLWPHESQHTRLPCPSAKPRIHSDSCPLSPWCHPAISSSVVHFFSWPQSLPASESFPMSHLFTWGGQSTRVSALASFLPKKSQGSSPSEWTSWISLQSKGLLRVFSNSTVQEHRFFGAQPSSQFNSHIHTWLLEKP